MMFAPSQFYYYQYPAYQPIKQMSIESQQRTRFTKPEDELLKKLVESQKQPNWNEIALKLKNRTARQCRERYNNYLRPNLINGPWTKEEEELLIQLYEKYGPKWSLISQSFNSRSPVNIKNHHSSMIGHLANLSRKNAFDNIKNVVDVENDEIAEKNVDVKSKNVENKTDSIDGDLQNLDFGADDLFNDSFIPFDNDLMVF